MSYFLGLEPCLLLFETRSMRDFVVSLYFVRKFDNQHVPRVMEMQHQISTNSHLISPNWSRSNLHVPTPAYFNTFVTANMSLNMILFLLNPRISLLKYWVVTTEIGRTAAINGMIWSRPCLSGQYRSERLRLFVTCRLYLDIWSWTTLIDSC